MSKKYFTKYIPVEGEIEKNEPFDPIVGIYGKKMKLFLCSRDIQVGDKVILEDHPDFGEKIILAINEGVVDLSNGGKTHNHNLIKIIGEISSEATWVTDGLEFDESQIKMGYLNSYGEFHENHFEEGKSIMVQIKGPCGHFH